MEEEEEKRRLQEADLREGGREPAAGAAGEAGGAGGALPAGVPWGEVFCFGGWKPSRDCLREWVREEVRDGNGDWRRVGLAEAAAEGATEEAVELEAAAGEAGATEGDASGV